MNEYNNLATYEINFFLNILKSHNHSIREYIMQHIYYVIVALKVVLLKSAMQLPVFAKGPGTMLMSLKLTNVTS